MTSRRTEDRHIDLINKLLLKSGIECVRTTIDSERSTSGSRESEDQGKVEQVEEQHSEPEPEEESIIEVEEEETEEQKIFPSPSLRRVLSDHKRKLESQLRIHVLPDEFKTHIDPNLIPHIAYTAPQKYMDILGELTGCTRYKSSLAEYWVLDTLANLLRRAQEDQMDKESQAVLILWFCEWMKEMQQFDAADRQRMLRRFKDTMLSAARVVAEYDHLPTPAEAGVHYKSQEDTESHVTSKVSNARHLVTFEGGVFSTDYQFDLVRSVFTHTPDYNLIDAPYQIRNPKRLFAPLKLKPRKERTPKKEQKPQKGKKKEVDTDEYLALLELKARDEREQEEQEERDQLEWHRRTNILPLQFAVDDEFFDKYWPPPPPEPEPEPEPEPQKKGKGKK
ncbi:uncharacterized protein LOC126979761 isoform X2 [Leptidea sinapis]|uniref:uncharacterized protein LOC126979761 isoform X2 n=1 Tax=Leptidea sinapis TaxID=189913 RepID=UPI0021C2C13D|nr:uncharacterized protein LOC126979761 isoform X2 [Leptidea sinapis]